MNGICAIGFLSVRATALDEFVKGCIAGPPGDLNTFKRSDNGLKHLLSKHCAECFGLPELYMTCDTEDFLLEPDRHYRGHIRLCGLDAAYEEHPGDHH